MSNLACDSRGWSWKERCGSTLMFLEVLIVSFPFLFVRKDLIRLIYELHFFFKIFPFRGIATVRMVKPNEHFIGPLDNTRMRVSRNLQGVVISDGCGAGRFLLTTLGLLAVTRCRRLHQVPAILGV